MPEIPDSRGGPFDEAEAYGDETRAIDRATRKKSPGEELCHKIPELHRNFLARIDRFVEFIFEHTKDSHEDLIEQLQQFLSRPEEGTPFSEYIHDLAPRIFSSDPPVFPLDQQTQFDSKLHNIFIATWLAGLSLEEITVADLVEEALILRAQVEQKDGFINYINSP